MPYQNLVNLNIGSNGSTNRSVQRTTTVAGGSGNSPWIQIGAPRFRVGVGPAALNTTYPVGSGPSTQAGMRNVYRRRATFARDLRDSQGRLLLKPRIAVSKFEKGAAQGSASVEGLTSPLEPLGIRLTVPAGLASPWAEVCDEVTSNIEDRLTAAAYAEFGSSSLTVRAQSFAPKILETESATARIVPVC